MSLDRTRCCHEHTAPARVRSASSAPEISRSPGRTARPTHSATAAASRSISSIKTRRAERAITFDPMLALPEAYHGWRARLRRGRRARRCSQSSSRTWGRPAASRRPGRRRSKACATRSAACYQVNTARPRAGATSQHHYDLSGELYRLFLDEDMQYSCAYFERPDMTLEEAQLAKKRHIAAKLRMKPGQSVLDIGSGWGGLGLYLAKSFDVDVLGVTLSTEQHAVATERARAEGLDRPRAFRDQGLSRPRRSASTASSRSACSSMSASTTTAPSSTNARRC